MSPSKTGLIVSAHRLTNITLLALIATLQFQREFPTYVLDKDTRPVIIRAIGVSHTACEDEFRQNLRFYSWSVFLFLLHVPGTRYSRWPCIVRVIYTGVRYCAGEIVWHNIDPSIVAGLYIVRMPGIVRVIFRDTYPHYIGPPTVRRTWVILKYELYGLPFLSRKSSANATAKFSTDHAHTSEKHTAGTCRAVDYIAHPAQHSVLVVTPNAQQGTCCALVYRTTCGLKGQATSM